jgi:glycosyltransferase involved in cell wall biosynthesis
MFKLLPCWTDHLIFAKRSIAPDFSGNTQKQSFIFNYSPLWLSGRDREEVDSSIRSQFEGKVVALHIGGFSRTRGWPQMLDALALMQNKELVILCFGKVDEGEGAFLGKAREVGVEHRVHLRSPIPYEQVFDYLLCADIGLMLYQPGIQNHIFAFPMKMYDYMLARLPFVGPNFSIEVIPVVEEETCGLLVNTGSAEEIATALDWLCDNLDEAKEMGCRGRRAAITKYNWESEAEKFIQIYKGFAGSNKINIYRCFTTVYEAVQIWKLT